MTRRQRRDKQARRAGHVRSIQRARTERRFQAEQAGLACVKAHPDWAPQPGTRFTVCECGRKLRKAKAHA